MFKHIIEFFVLFSVVGYWAQSGSPRCLICFFLRLRTHKWYFLFSLQPFRVQEFEEVQGRLFWKILWRTTKRITRNHLPDKQMTQEEDENESQICLFVYHNWSFWTISFSPCGLSHLPTQFPYLNSVSAFTSIFSYSSHMALIFSYILPVKLPQVISKLLEVLEALSHQGTQRNGHTSFLTICSLTFTLRGNGPCWGEFNPRRLVLYVQPQWTVKGKIFFSVAIVLWPSLCKWMTEGTVLHIYCLGKPPSVIWTGTKETEEWSSGQSALAEEGRQGSSTWEH